MKKKERKSVLTYGLAALMIAILLFAGCTVNAENKKSEAMDTNTKNINDIKKDLDEAKMEYNKKYETFKMEGESKITENEKTIADLKARTKNKNKTVQANLEKKLTELEEKNRSMKIEIENYEDTDFDKWEAFTVEFNRDMDTLGDALKDLTKKNVK